jgi:hypothetical protein
MWLYHVPFIICVVSVLKIAFCDQKKGLTIFYLNLLFFFKHLTIFNKKGYASLCNIHTTWQWTHSGMRLDMCEIVCWWRKRMTQIESWKNKHIDGFYTKTTQKGGFSELCVKIKKRCYTDLLHFSTRKHNFVSFFGRIVFWQ